jgi:hypothetical protein
MPDRVPIDVLPHREHRFPLPTEPTRSSAKPTRPRRHPYTLRCATNLVMELRADGADAADTLFVETMRRYPDTYGADQPETIAVSRSLPPRGRRRYPAASR